MNVVQAVVLGAVEGITEFLSVSSTPHLLITDNLLGLPMNTQQERDAIIGFKAVVQVGAIPAAVR